MQIDTKYFGPVEYEEGDLLRFPNGLFGFEAEHSFLLLPFAGSNGSLLSLQSVSTPALAFVVIDPFSLCPDYTQALSPEELRFLGVKESGELGYYVLCVVKEPVSESTVNLRCPVVIHPDDHTAIQVILEDTPYHMRHRLGDFSHGGGASPC